MKLFNWILIILSGIGVFIWSWRLWRVPSRLHRGTIMYRFVQSLQLRWFSKKSEQLSVGGIKNYAKRSMVVSFLVILCGLVGLVMSLTLPSN